MGGLRVLSRSVLSAKRKHALLFVTVGAGPPLTASVLALTTTLGSDSTTAGTARAVSILVVGLGMVGFGLRDVVAVTRELRDRDARKQLPSGGV